MFRQRLNMLPLSITLRRFQKADAGPSQEGMQQAQDSKCKQLCTCQWLVVTEHVGYDPFRQSGEIHEPVMETYTYQQSHNKIVMEMITSHCSVHCWHSFSTALLPQACDCLLPAA